MSREYSPSDVTPTDTPVVLEPDHIIDNPVALQRYGRTLANNSGRYIAQVIVGEVVSERDSYAMPEHRLGLTEDEQLPD